MIDKNRIRLMSKMALYEKTLGSEDLKISRYYKNDYTSINTLITAIWITIGYALATGLVMMCTMDVWMENLTIQKMIMIASVIVGTYLVVLVMYIVCAGSFYRKKHNKAKQRVKMFYRDLSRLGKMYMKEKK